MVEIVANSIATKELVVGKGSGMSSVDTSADDLLILGSGTAGMSIMSSYSGNIFFGDAASNVAGKIVYSHVDDSLGFACAGSTGFYLFSDKSVQIREASDKTPDISPNASGGIFISGGALWYKGFSGTYTKLAAS